MGRGGREGKHTTHSCISRTPTSISSERAEMVLGLSVRGVWLVGVVSSSLHRGVTISLYSSFSSLQNEEWQNEEWQNEEWQNEEWMNEEWLNEEWLNEEWQNEEWLNEEWLNEEWLNEEWQNEEWQNEEWQNEEWQNGNTSTQRLAWNVAHLVAAATEYGMTMLSMS